MTSTRTCHLKIKNTFTGEILGPKPDMEWLYPTLLQACHQIRSEAQSGFYGENIFALAADCPDAFRHTLRWIVDTGDDNIAMLRNVVLSGFVDHDFQVPCGMKKLEPVRIVMNLRSRKAVLEQTDFNHSAVLEKVLNVLRSWGPGDIGTEHLLRLLKVSGRCCHSYHQYSHTPVPVYCATLAEL